ncbi:MAG: restriction endonuclease subunit S, partial [Clostridiaceae bacterium]|nr:restriction endonuclease subunit S [Clostridiaceae bacterium]
KKDILPANVNQHVCIIRPNGYIITEYLYLVLSSFLGQFQIEHCQTGANREGLNFEQLKNFTIPLPPIFEQKKIIGNTYAHLNKIDKTIALTEKEISLIEEYQTVLINEAVTGKIDIRE